MRYHFAPRARLIRARIILFAIIPAVLLVAALGYDAPKAQMSVAGSFSIGGVITDESGATVGGVLVSLSGSGSATTTTAADGSYSFGGLAGAGTYTVTPAGNYSFAPQTQTFSDLSSNITADFIAGPLLFKLSGVVTGANGAGLGGVTLLLDGTLSASTATASDGSYSFAELPGGASFTVTPSLPGYTFFSRTFFNLSRNLVANFGGAPTTYSISGRVTAAGSGFGGVAVRLSGARTASTTTGADGSYAFTGLSADGDYTVGISYPANSFTGYALLAPTSQSFSHLTANLTADFKVGSLSKSVGSFTAGPLVGDFNGDGKPDLATVGGGAVKVWLGNGDGTFQASSSQIGSGFVAQAITSGDFNRDGMLDLALASTDSFGQDPKVQLFFGNGDGTLRQSTESYTVGNLPFEIVVGDFDGDGNPDLATINRYGTGTGPDTSNGNISVLLGKGDGTFRGATNYAAGPLNVAVVAGDFTGDGRPDLAIIRQSDISSVLLLVNKGDGTFRDAVTVSTGLSTHGVAADDLNGDGKLDLVLLAGGSAETTVSVLLGNGDGTFKGPVKYQAGTPTTPLGIAIGDLNGDHKLDLLASGDRIITLLAGNGDGTFSPGVALFADPSFGLPGVLLSDFNSDGKTDVTFSYYHGSNGSVKVMLNSPPSPAPLGYSVSGRLVDDANSPLAGVPVVLGGDQFGSTITDADGSYSFANVVAGSSVTVTAAKAFYNFSPASQTVSIDGNKVGIDFVGSRQRFSLAGRVTERGVGMGGVPVALGSSAPGFAVQMGTTDSAGNYLFTGLAAGAIYTVTPVRHGYGFSPGAQSVLLSSDRTSLNFTAFSIPVAVQFDAISNSVGEGDGRAVVTVERTGGTAGTLKVDYSTVDDPSAVGCGDRRSMPGVAFARCDYTTAVGTLTFAPGETKKTFTVPVVDDAYAEGTEFVRLKLTNPVGVALGSQSVISLAITDNDTVDGANPYFNTDFFVRQQYLDLLAREPEQGQPWSSLLNGCADQFNGNPSTDFNANPSGRCDRISLSYSFFNSAEFQLKGAFVFRFYRASLGRLPHYTEMVADMSSVTGSTSAEVFANKSAFTNAWAQRQEFKNNYDPLPNAAFVDALMNHYGSLPSVTTPDPANPDGATKVTLTRAALVNSLNISSLTRAQVVRAVADSDEVSSAELNNGFVAMQYFGYLRRDPDSGYNDWLTYLNAHPGDYRTMVFGFIYSPEYKSRFGQP